MYTQVGRRRATLVAVLASVVLGFGLLSACSTPPAARKVVLFGDSEGMQVQQPFSDALGAKGRPLDALTWGGIAPCDSAQYLSQHVTPGATSHVFLLFSGAVFTPCMRNAAGNPVGANEGVRRYYRATEQIIVQSVAVGARVHIVLPPPIRTNPASLAAETFRQRLVDEVYRPLVARYAAKGVGAVDAAEVLGKEFRLRDTCWLIEMCDANGRVQIRNSDGVHFCVQTNELDPWHCPGYNPGAIRVANLMASTV